MDSTFMRSLGWANALTGLAVALIGTGLTVALEFGSFDEKSLEMNAAFWGIPPGLAQYFPAAITCLGVVNMLNGNHMVSKYS